MRNAGGWHETVYRDGRVEEHDTFQCAHCNRIVLVGAKQDPTELGGVCTRCTTKTRMGLVCKGCAAKLPACSPIEKNLERHEARDRFFRSIGL